MTRLGHTLRRLKFALLEKVVLPPGVVALRLLVRTWRPHRPDEAAIRELAQIPRLIVVTYHGMLLHLLPFAPLARAYGRRFVVMVSPSRDGQLLGAALHRFGVGHVRGTTGSRGVAGALEFIARVEAGDVGIIAADGPRGPCGVIKPGVLRVAAAARAHLVLVATSANRGITFRSWDRSHLPAPFARVELSLQLLPPPVAGDNERAVAAIQEALSDTARHMSSPVLG
jgi:lysophospholipid acyltransferase (LPLAT)-like uncharacterized protein